MQAQTAQNHRTRQTVQLPDGRVLGYIETKLNRSFAVKFAGIYGILVGLMMIGQWLFFLAVGQVPELHTEPYRIALHLAAEFLTAGGLIVAGAALLRRSTWGASAYLVFAGMLTYSVIASPGYFAQQGQWALVGMFAVLLVLAITSTLAVARRGVA